MTMSSQSSVDPLSIGRIAVDEGIVATARDLGPVIAKHVETTERDRRLARPVIDVLRAAGFFRLFTPRALGGLEIDPVTFARVVEEVSTFDSAAGWSFQINTGAWWTSRMSPEGVAELYADGPDLMMAASFAPPHRAEETPGGYRITGRGPLASTIHDSRWALMSAIVFDGDRPRVTPAGPDFISVVMHTTEVEIIDTWHALGMRGTDSNDIDAKGVFVPESRAFRFEPDSIPAAPFDGPASKEVAFRTPIPARDVVTRAREHGVHPGYPLGRDYPGLDDVLLVALTEKRTPADVDRLAEVLAGACS